MPALDKLSQKTADAIAALPGTPGSATWQKAFERTIAQAHTAAYYAGQAERLNVSVATMKGLSRAERADVKKAVKAQLGYLKDFAAAAPDMSEAAVANRAQMYGGAIRGTYYGARHPGLTQVPGDGQSACLTNCKCFLTEQDDGIHWELSAAENCQDCIDMAAGGPYGRE